MFKAFKPDGLLGLALLDSEGRRFTLQNIALRSDTVVLRLQPDQSPLASLGTLADVAASWRVQRSDGTPLLRDWLNDRVEQACRLVEEFNRELQGRGDRSLAAIDDPALQEKLRRAERWLRLAPGLRVGGQDLKTSLKRLREDVQADQRRWTAVTENRRSHEAAIPEIARPNAFTCYLWSAVSEAEAAAALTAGEVALVPFVVRAIEKYWTEIVSRGDLAAGGKSRGTECVRIVAGIQRVVPGGDRRDSSSRASVKYQGRVQPAFIVEMPFSAGRWTFGRRNEYCATSRLLLAAPLEASQIQSLARRIADSGAHIRAALNEFFQHHGANVPVTGSLSFESLAELRAWLPHPKHRLPCACDQIHRLANACRSGHLEVPGADSGAIGVTVTEWLLALADPRRDWPKPVIKPVTSSIADPSHGHRGVALVAVALLTAAIVGCGFFWIYRSSARLPNAEPHRAPAPSRSAASPEPPTPFGTIPVPVTLDHYPGESFENPEVMPPTLPLTSTVPLGAAQPTTMAVASADVLPHSAPSPLPVSQSSASGMPQPAPDEKTPVARITHEEVGRGGRRPGAAAARLPAGALAEVNGHPILESDIDAVIDAGVQGRQVSTAQRAELKRRYRTDLLNLLIDIELFEEQAGKENVTVSEEEIASKLETELSNFGESENLTKEELAGRIKQSTGLEMRVFMAKRAADPFTRKMLLKAKLIAKKFPDQVKVKDDEVQQYYLRLSGTKSPRPITLEAATPWIREKLQQEKINSQAQKYGAELRKKARITYLSPAGSPK